MWAITVCGLLLCEVGFSSSKKRSPGSHAVSWLNLATGGNRNFHHVKLVPLTISLFVLQKNSL